MKMKTDDEKYGGATADEVIDSMQEEIGRLQAECDGAGRVIASLITERDEARANNRKKLCVYCGYAAEHDDPEKCRDLIVEHVIACPKNLFRVEADRLGEELVAVAKDRDDALVLLGEADRAREAAEAENARLREALRRIADVADSPAYGVAKDALREKG